MELKTILAILYANNLENVVTKAIAIDNGFDNNDLKVIRVSISKDKLPKGKTFGNGKSYGYLDCPVIGYNQYKLENNYLIQWPNGDTSWQSYSDYNSREGVTEIIDVEQLPA